MRQFWLCMTVFDMGADVTSHSKTVILCLFLKVGGLLTLIASLVGFQPPILNPETGVWTIKSWSVLKKEKVKL